MSLLANLKWRFQSCLDYRIEKIREKVYLKLKKYNLIRDFDEVVEETIENLYNDDSNKTFKVFKDYEQLLEWGEEKYGSWARSLSAEEHEYLQYYGGNYYRATNKYLRGSLELYHRGTEDDLKKIISLLDSVLDRATAVENMIAFRWINTQDFCDWAGDFQWKVFSKFIEGKTLHEKAFLSTSLKIMGTPSTIDDNKRVLLILRVPKGTHGAFIAHVSLLTAECEFLMAKGQSIKIRKVLYSALDNAIFLCDVMNEA